MDTVAAIDKPAPLFTLPDLSGTDRSLQDWRGRVVIVNFWSAECPWSERTDLHLLAHLPVWGDRVVLCSIAANAHETHELVARVARERGLPLVLLDPEQQAASLYGAQTTPHAFVIDPEGVLRYQGAVDDVTFRRREPSQYYLRNAVEAVLAGQKPSPAATAPYGCAIVHAGDL